MNIPKVIFSSYRLRVGLPTAMLFSLALVIFPKPGAAAPIVVEKPDYSLTFPDGYAEMPGFPESDSGFTLMDTASTGVMVIGQGAHMTGSLTTSQYVAIYSAAYSNSFTRTDSTTKTMGGNSFTMLAYKDLSADGDSTSRLRIYFTTKNHYLFLAYTVYDVADEATAVPPVEAALATLKITATAAIRRLAVTVNGSAPTFKYDVSGRMLSIESPRLSRMPVFQAHK